MKYGVVYDGACVLACDGEWSAGRERRCQRDHAVRVLGPGAEGEGAVAALAAVLASRCGASPGHLVT